MNAFLTHPPKPVSYILPNSNYYIRISILRDDKSLCGECVNSISQIGGYPEIVFDVVSSVNTTMIDWVDTWTAVIAKSYSTYWYIPFQTLSGGVFAYDISLSPFSSLEFVSLMKKTAYFGYVTLLHRLQPNGDYLFILGSNVYNSTLIDPYQFNVNLMEKQKVQGVSPVWFLKPTIGSIVAVSYDHLKSIIFYNVTNSAFPQNFQNVCNDNTNTVYDGFFLDTAAVLATNKGVVVGTFNVTYLGFKLPPQGYPSLLSGCSLVTAISNTSDIYYMKNTTFTFYKAITENGASITEHVGNNSTLIDVTTSVLSCEAITAIVKINGVYSLYKFTPIRRLSSMTIGRWVNFFTFPQSIPIVPNDSLILTTIFSNRTFSGPNTMPLVITSVDYTQSLSNELIVGGNSLLYSVNDGLGFVIMHSIPNILFTDILADASMTLIYTDSTGKSYITKRGLPYTRIISSKEVTNTSIADSYVDFRGLVYYFDLYFDTNTTLQSSTGLLNVDSAISEQEYLVQNICPFSSFSLDLNLTTDLTRVTYVSNVNFAPNLFLDQTEIHKFTIQLTPQTGKIAESMNLLYSLMGGDASLKIKIQKIYDLTSVLFIVSVIENNSLGNNLYFPGSYFLQKTVRFIIENSTLACKNDQSISNFDSFIGFDITYNVGCPGHREMEIEIDNSHNINCPFSDNLPCSFYDETFSPSVFIKDNISNLRSLYNNSYNIQIIDFNYGYYNAVDFMLVACCLYGFHLIMQTAVYSQITIP
ncbi:hypothetical protein ROZALSC1DRAFT_28638 [Rozella allomycis CSF55]|uniref:Uncharacterized protein n=1 Tax=Rozella allomycis (strain CSF55) TaxID=988480 RepID=A0A4P9YK55_ROZAC|nr:hypothetical protein ROZALSC1DRAFT_28638 [Rozella allomycis CSF55]